MRFIASLLVFAAAAAPALAKTYAIDPAHSGITFKVRHLATRMPGSFNEFSGTIVYDEKKPAKSSVEAVIQAASIDTRNEKRDAHLRNPDFFDVEKYPTITFKSVKVTPQGPGRLKVAGKLSMHGVEKPVALDVESLGVMKDPQGKNRAGFSASGKFNRKDFGIVWNKTLDAGGYILGDEVTFTIDIEAIESEEAK